MAKIFNWRKDIAHHLIRGPCKLCLVRATCRIKESEFCEEILSFYYHKCNVIERQQMLNYIRKRNK